MLTSLRISLLMLLLTSVAQATPVSAKNPTIRLDYTQLLSARNNFNKGKKPYVSGVNQLDAQAAKLLNIKPLTIVNKTVLPASGNPHDYFSFAPYWWPNPKTADGMPWIQLDGKINPASRDSRSDKVAFNELVNSTQVLSSAYFFTQKKPYATKAAELIRVWFLDEATKMNPHLNYAQAIPGSFDGRGIGIIDSRLLYRIVDSIRLLDTASVFTPKEMAGLQKWFADYVDWLVQSPLGQDERKALNNHGTFYDLQVVAFALFAGREDIARATLEQTKKRITAQFDTEGKQWRELERTRPFHYSVFNLQAFFGLAKMAKDLNVDLWNYPTAQDARIKAGMNYVLARMEKETTGAAQKSLR